jgi:hypothetical protein
MQVSPGKSGPKPTAHQNDVANDPLESVRRKAEKAFKVLSRRNSMTPRDSSCAAAMPQSASSSGIKWCENNVMWSSLSSSLVRHGKVHCFIVLFFHLLDEPVLPNIQVNFDLLIVHGMLFFSFVTSSQEANATHFPWQEAMKQRDVALQAVLNGLLEATATEKLIKCLR